MKNKEIEELLNNIKEQLIIDEKLGKEIAQDFYKTILNYEETKLLLSYIEQLEKKVDQYENPDDLTLFYMWLDTKAKDKMKQLEKRNKQLYEGFMATQEELTDYATENEQLKKQKDDVVEYIKNKREQLHHSFDEPGWDYLFICNPDELLRMLGEIE